MKEIIFLGTAGARFVVFRQIRASGGMWLRTDSTNILIDPGPGSLVQILKSRSKLNPEELDAIIISHRHLDHSADVNIIIEAMTQGGLKQRGTLFAPSDALEGDDPVVLKYLRGYLKNIAILKENSSYKIRDIKFYVPCRHQHRGETYGIKFNMGETVVSYVADTKYFTELELCYKGSDVLIVNVVRLKESPELDHLSIPEAGKLFSAIKPKLGIITHFGMGVVKAKPWVLAEELSKKTNLKIIAARDGMKIDPNSL